MKPTTIRVTKRTGAVVLAALCVSCATARVQKRAPCAPAAATAQARLEIFDRPFAGEYPSGTFDHDLPILYEDRNNYFLNACGQRVNGSNGHTDYDWLMPTGTPLLAVADGRIVRAEQEQVTCGGGPVGAKVVVIETRPNATDVIRASYGHLDRITSPSAIPSAWAMSSALRATRAVAKNRTFISGRADARRARNCDRPVRLASQTLTDPWSVDKRGTSSLWLWRPDAAPRLFR